MLSQKVKQSLDILATMPYFFILEKRLYFVLLTQDSFNGQHHFYGLLSLGYVPIELSNNTKKFQNQFYNFVLMKSLSINA